MTARDIIAKAISGAPFPSARSLSKADQVISDFDAAGIAVVPKEPTEAMLSAFNRHCDENGGCMVKTGYRVMIDAAKENV